MRINRLMRMLVRRYPFSRARGRVLAFAMRHVGGFEVGSDDDGNTFLLDLGNYIDSRMFLEGCYERAGVELLNDYVDRYDCRWAIDVGANIGAYTIPLAKNPKLVEVHAFEPDPRNHAQLWANVFLNDVSEKVSVHDVALSSISADAALHVSRTPRRFDSGKLNTGTASLVMNDRRHDESVAVRTERLDDVLDIEGESVVVKIDVEGHELEVLKGMERILAKDRCVIQVEAFAERRSAVDTFLADLGYEFSDANINASANVIYVKR